MTQTSRQQQKLTPDGKKGSESSESSSLKREKSAQNPDKAIALDCTWQAHFGCANN